MDAIYISSSSFKVLEDKTTEFVVGRRVKSDCGLDGVKYASVVSASYSSPYTTVIIDESDLTASLAYVWYGIVAMGPSGSLPDHTHNDEGQGGTISGTGVSELIGLTDTPSGYDDGKYLKSTAAGTEWATVSGAGGTTSGTDDHSHSAYVPWDFGSGTISGIGDIYCNDIYTSSGTVYIGELQLSTDGTNLLVGGAPIAATGGSTTLSGLSDTPSGYDDGKYLISTASGTEWAAVGASDDQTFLNLTDTPATYTDTDGQLVVSTGSGIEFSPYSVTSVSTDYYADELVQEWNITNSGIDQTFTWDGDVDDVVTFQVINAEIPTGSNIKLIFNDDSGSNYERGFVSQDGAAIFAAANAATAYLLLSNSSSNVESSSCTMYLKNTGNKRVMIQDMGSQRSDDADKFWASQVSVFWDNTVDKITSFKIWSDNTDITGTFRLFKRVNIQLPVVSGTNGVDGAAGAAGSTTFSGLTDTPSGYDVGKYLRSTASGTEWATVSGGGAGSSDVQTFLDLTDTPSTYSGTSGKYMFSTGSGIEFGGALQGVAVFDGYDSTEVIFDGTAATVPIDTLRKNSDSTIFSFDDVNYAVTVNKQGTYMVTYRVSTNNNSVVDDRCTSMAWLELHAGSGYNTVLGSDGHMYNRIGTEGRNTCNVTVALDLNQGDILRIRVNRTGGTNDITTLSEGGSLTIYELLGIKGDTGSQGESAVTWYHGANPDNTFGEINDFYLREDDKSVLLKVTGWTDQSPAPDTLHDLGSNQEGNAGFTPDSAPTDAGDYYIFDGSTSGLRLADDYGDEAALDVKIKFRIHDKSKGLIQTLWKSGGYTNGMGVGLDASNNLGIFCASSDVLSSITFNNTQFSENVWYILYVSTIGKIALLEDGTGNFIEKTGTVTAVNGSSLECIGFNYDANPIDAGNTNAGPNDYFDGDIDYVEITAEGTMDMPTTSGTGSWVNQGYLGALSYPSDFSAYELVTEYNLTDEILDTTISGWSGDTDDVILIESQGKNTSVSTMYFHVRFNGDTTVNYRYQFYGVGQGGSASVGEDDTKNEMHLIGGIESTKTWSMNALGYLSSGRPRTIRSETARQDDSYVETSVWSNTDDEVTDIRIYTDQTMTGYVKVYRFGTVNLPVVSGTDGVDGVDGATKTVILTGSGAPTVDDPAAAKVGDYYFNLETADLYEKNSLAATEVFSDTFPGTTLSGVWSTRIVTDASVTVSGALELNNLSTDDHSGAHAYIDQAFSTSDLYIYTLTCKWKPHKNHHATAWGPAIVFRHPTTFNARAEYGDPQSNYISILLVDNTNDSTDRTLISILEPSNTIDTVAITIDETQWHDLEIILNLHTREITVNLDGGVTYSATGTVAQSTLDGIGNEMRVEFSTADYQKDNTEYFDDVLLTRTSLEVWADLGNISGTFLDLNDTPATYSGVVGQYLRATASGTEWAAVGASDVQTFLDLTDTPSTYSAAEGKYLKVTSSGVGFEDPAVSYQGNWILVKSLSLSDEPVNESVPWDGNANPRIRVEGIGEATTNGVYIRPNNDSGSNYPRGAVRVDNTTVQGTYSTETGVLAIHAGIENFNIVDGYLKNTGARRLFLKDNVRYDTANSDRLLFRYAHHWTNTADDVTSITITSDGSNVTGEVKVYRWQDITEIPVDKGKQSLKVEYATTSGIYINPGTIHMKDSSFGMYDLADRLEVSFDSLAADTWYYVYTNVSGSAVALDSSNFTVSSGVPTIDYPGMGYYSGNDRCVGFVYTNTSSGIGRFKSTGLKYLYDIVIEDRAVASITGYENVSHTSPLGNLVVVSHIMVKDAGSQIDILWPDDTFPDIRMTGIVYGRSSGAEESVVAEFETDSNKQIRYWSQASNASTTSDSFKIQTLGFYSPDYIYTGA